MNVKNKKGMSYRSIMILTLIAGIAGTALQFILDFWLLAFMLTVGVLGGLIGGTNGYEEPERQQLERSYRQAFEWLLLVVLAAYAVVEVSKWFVGIAGAAAFLNGHWPGLMLSAMCISLGMAGLQNARTAGSA